MRLASGFRREIQENSD